MASWTEIFEDETAFKLQVQSTENSKSSEKGYVNSSHSPLRKSSFFFSFSLFFFHFFIFFPQPPKGQNLPWWRGFSLVLRQAGNYHNRYSTVLDRLKPSTLLYRLWLCTVRVLMKSWLKSKSKLWLHGEHLKSWLWLKSKFYDFDLSQSHDYGPKGHDLSQSHDFDFDLSHKILT